MVVPIPAMNAYEPGMGAGVVNPTDLVHGPLAYSGVEKILNCPIQKISRGKLWEMRPLVKGHAALVRRGSWVRVQAGSPLFNNLRILDCPMKVH